MTLKYWKWWDCFLCLKKPGCVNSVPEDSIRNIHFIEVKVVRVLKKSISNLNFTLQAARVIWVKGQNHQHL